MAIQIHTSYAKILFHLFTVRHYEPPPVAMTTTMTTRRTRKRYYYTNGVMMTTTAPRFLARSTCTLFFAILLTTTAPSASSFLVRSVLVLPQQQQQQQQQQQRHHDVAASTGRSHYIVSAHHSNNPFKDSMEDDSSSARTETTISTTTTTTDEALQRTASHLHKLQRQQQSPHSQPQQSQSHTQQQSYRAYLQWSANALKAELKTRGLPRTGRKPDLAWRLVQADDDNDDDNKYSTVNNTTTDTSSSRSSPLQHTTAVTTFASLVVSDAARRALGHAGFLTSTPIQEVAIPAIAGRHVSLSSSSSLPPRQQQQQSTTIPPESVLLHAQTGSGKTLAYVLPCTERLWKSSNDNEETSQPHYTVILTPTRELAAQVAGVATALAPPNTVRLVSRPMNLLSDGLKERGEVVEYGGRLDEWNDENENDTSIDSSASSSFGRMGQPRLFVGSAKAIMHSLYGDGVMPASPTSKPEAMFFLRNVQCLILDEVDRLLLGMAQSGKSTRRNNNNSSTTKRNNKRHEKPAAVVAAAVARLTLGRAQVVAASATVGRPLKRELTRVLGLAPQDCPRVIRAHEIQKTNEQQQQQEQQTSVQQPQEQRVGRAVTMPSTVRNYVVPVDGSSVGMLLTSAFQVIQRLSQSSSSRGDQRMLLVLTRGCGMNIKNAIGALKHFRCQPEPQSLLDALEASGTDQLIQVHRKVSGSTGVGESGKSNNSEQQQEGYLLVTGEETVRGLHLDGLDTVIVVGRAHGPDEYTHIAGRTGRAGRSGKVINVVSDANAAALRSWERMLEVEFKHLDLKDISALE